MESLQENVSGRIFKFLCSVVSDVGVKRNENQDAFSIAHSREASLFIIADGMGGARGGATASALAASIVGLEAFNPDGSISLESFRRVIEQANLAIHARSIRDKDLKGMGTTIAGLAFVENKVLVSSVGDSRVYFLRGSNFRQLTKDHTFVQELVEKGAIKVEEAASHPISHMLTRSLGPVDKVNVDTFEYDNQVGDRYLICSDGLYNHVTSDEIREILAEKNPDEACERLLQMAIERGGSDNITIQVIETLELNDTSFVFPLPTPGKVELNLLGRVEEREIGSEVDQEFDFFVLEEAAADEEKPAVFNQKIEPLRPNRFYWAGAIVAALFAVIVFNISQSQSSKAVKKIKKIKVVKPQVVEEPESKFSISTEESGEPEEILENVETVPFTEPQVAEENQVAQSEPVAESNQGPTSEEAVSEKFDPKLLDKVLKQANSLEVADAPKIKIDIEQDPPDQPIVWENEDLKLGKIKNPKPVEREPADVMEISGDSFKILAQKKEIRQKINDLDFKLQLLMDDFKKEQEPKLVKESEDAKLAIEALKSQMLEIEQELLIWKGVDQISDQTAFLEYLEKTSTKSESIKKILAEYQAVDQIYKDAVKMWHQNPRDLSLASAMGAKARRRDEFFNSIQDSVKKAVKNEIFKVFERYAEKNVEKENAESLLQNLNRRKGYIQASFDLDPSRAVSMKEQYLSERGQLLNKLDRLKVKLPDENELEVQKNLILSELKNSL